MNIPRAPTRGEAFRYWFRLGWISFGAPFPAIVAAAALIGAIGGRIAPAAFDLGIGHAEALSAHPPALIDDDTPTPAHARYSTARLAAIVVAFVAIGAAAWGALAW